VPSQRRAIWGAATATPQQRFERGRHPRDQPDALPKVRAQEATPVGVETAKPPRGIRRRGAPDPSRHGARCEHMRSSPIGEAAGEISVLDAQPGSPIESACISVGQWPENEPVRQPMDSGATHKQTKYGVAGRSTGAAVDALLLAPRSPLSARRPSPRWSPPRALRRRLTSPPDAG
jgi:hypothetical protein